MNDRIYIEGGHQLKGSIRIQGSKNAALPMMAASLLHRGVSVLKGCPRIADVFCMEEILQKLGAVTCGKTMICIWTAKMPVNGQFLLNLQGG